MLICTECGNHFEAGEARICTERHGLRGPAERIPCCPCCGSPSLEAAKQCSLCGSWHLAGELHEGDICPSCLDKAITAETVTKYIKSDRHILDDFLCDWVRIKAESLDSQDQLSYEARELLWDAWQRFSEVPWHRFDVLAQCRQFIGYDLDDFADWLSRQEEKK